MFDYGAGSKYVLNTPLIVYHAMLHLTELLTIQVAVECSNRKSDLLLYDGDYFGDESMVISKARKITTRALTHVDMFCLRNSDLEEAFMSYPEERKRVEENLGLE